jgi:hypothetical protein
MRKSGLNPCSDKVSDYLCGEEDGRNPLYFHCKNMKYWKIEMSFKTSQYSAMYGQPRLSDMTIFVRRNISEV